MLLTEKNIKKIKIKSQKILKNNDSPKIEKKERAEVEQYLEEHIESAIWAVFACAEF